MIGHSVAEYILVRSLIFLVRAVAPLSTAFTLVLPYLIYRFGHPVWLLFVGIWALAETIFLFLVFLPLKWRLLKDEHAGAPLTQERRELFNKCMTTLPHPETFLRRWFLDSPAEDIKKENLNEFFAWALFNKALEAVDDEDRDELNDYVRQFEAQLGRRLEDGRGKAKSMRSSFDTISALHRPLVFYLLVWVLDVLSSLRLLFTGWRFYSQPLSRMFGVFPPRPLGIIGSSRSSAKTITYWHHKGDKDTNLPILFIHGITLGLFPYLPFLDYLRKDDKGISLEVIAIEIMPVSTRLCAGAATVETMREEISSILAAHGWDEFVLVGNSFGSGIAASLISDPNFSQRVKSLVLLDPVCFLLHLPDITYNFTRRPPRRANEHLMHYFCSTDLMIAHTLARRFFWSQHILWLEDLDNIPTFVVIGEQDHIIDIAALWSYLTHSSPQDESVMETIGSAGWDAREIAKSRQVETWKFNRLDHAGFFSRRICLEAVCAKIRSAAKGGL